MQSPIDPSFAVRAASRRWPWLAVPCALMLLLAGGALAGSSTQPVPEVSMSTPKVERIEYRWRLGRFLGVIASIFLPRTGEGLLTVETAADNTVKSELLITASKDAAGDYFRYGSVVDRSTGTTLRAWSSYRWRGEIREKSGDVGTPGVVDIASGIDILRRDPPRAPRRMEIWSDGKVYPVLVQPLGDEVRIVGGRRVLARHLSIRGVDGPTKHRWTGRLDLWLARDAAATPVAISIERRGAAIQLETTSP